MKKLTLMIAVGTLAPCVVAAQSFDGAYISLERYSASSDDTFDGETNYFGTSMLSLGGEIGFGSRFALSGDVSNYGGDIRDVAVTVHVLYRVTPTAAIGAFYGYEAESWEDYIFTGYGEEFVSGTWEGTFYGAEGKAALGNLSGEAFAGKSEGDLFAGSLYGISGKYARGSLAFTAAYDVVDSDAPYNWDRSNRVAIGGEWNSGSGTMLFAEIGQINDYYTEDGEDFSAASSFISVGIRVGLGPNKGTTFGPRSYRSFLY